MAKKLSIRSVVVIMCSKFFAYVHYHTWIAKAVGWEFSWKA